MDFYTEALQLEKISLELEKTKNSAWKPPKNNENIHTPNSNSNYYENF